MRRAVLPDILVQTAENIDERVLFKLHLFDALTYRAKGFYREVYPSGVVFGAGVVHLFADAEPDALPVFGELESRCAVISLGDDDISCDYLEHKMLLSCRCCLL